MFAWDVDETLSISRGPCDIEDLRKLHEAGHVVGICGNWGLFCAVVPDWHRFTSFVNCCPTFQDQWGKTHSKDWFLNHLATYIKADSYYFIGNIIGEKNKLGHVCGSDDKGNCERAGPPWTFIKEDDWVLEDYI